MSYAIGDRVLRLEEQQAAEVVEVYPVDLYDEPLYRLRYDEGGEGVWPEGALAPVMAEQG